MMDKRQISFVGKNDGLAIGLMNHINLMKVFFASLMIWSIPGIILILLKKYTILYFLIFPLFFLILSFAIFLFVKLDTEIFLKGQKKEHDFYIIDNRIYKDNREVKLIKKIKIYKYRNFLFMVTSHSMFIIRNNDYFTGDREAFLAWIKQNNIKCVIGF